MKFKCDKCDRPATFHLTDIGDDHEIVVRHLCPECAGQEGIQPKSSVSTSHPLESLIMAATITTGEDLTCDVCGTTFAEFQAEGRLGCPNDYDAFATILIDAMEHAHEGASQHVGKVPHRVGGDQQKQSAILRLRVELKNVIAAEDYEHAAAIRDQIRQLEDL